MRNDYDSRRLQYNSTTKQYSSAPGVETRIPGFGHTFSIEYLDPNTKWFSTTNYFHNMVQHFVDKGYMRGKNIVGAPYDWRYSPSKFPLDPAPPENWTMSLLLHNECETFDTIFGHKNECCIVTLNT